jgi:hypothetical protein
MILSNTSDLEQLLQEVARLMPTDDAARTALAQQQSVFRFLDANLTKAILLLNANTHKSIEFSQMLTLLVAELAKDENGRLELSSNGLFIKLLDLFLLATQPLQASPKLNDFDALNIQCLRAIANLCYNHGFFISDAFRG